MSSSLQAFVSVNPEVRQPLFEPSVEQISATRLTAFIGFCERRTGHVFPSYPRFERFCIEKSSVFWSLFLEWSRLLCEGDKSTVITDARCEQARFFPDVRLNYVENLLRVDSDDVAASRPALTMVHLDRTVERWSRGELRSRVSALAAALHGLGFGPGTQVVVVARNAPAAILGCLAAQAIGCTVATGAPEMGTSALLSRFAQTAPTLLMADVPHDISASVDGQHRERLAEIINGLTTLRGVLLLNDAVAPSGLGVPVYRAEELIASHADQTVAWPRLPFNHPLFVLFTSGTTGAPKCVVHGAGGTLLEHVKEHRLHCDFRSTDKLFFHTSIGWMMWNWQLSLLATGAELLLYDGPVASADSLWRIVSDQKVTVFGTSPAYLQLCQGVERVVADLDFTALRAVLSTGSILYPPQQEWVWRNVKPLPVQSISGGTDIVGCFVLGNPNVPAYSAECQSRSLGLDVQALHASTSSQGSLIGDLICANPFPSRPIGFLNDADGTRFHAAYFADNPGVWTHGDLIEFTPEGSARMHGRSDGVLNIRGIRIGPAEIYRILADIPEIAETMAVEQYSGAALGNARLVLLVVLKPHAQMSDPLKVRIKLQLGRRGSAAHVPAIILVVDQLPVTHSGKRSERSARDALNGRPIVNAGALRNPECLEVLKAYAANMPVSAEPAQGDDDVPGASPQQLMTRIWERVLELSPIAPDDNFFDLGGDSLAALRVFQEIQQRTGRELPITLLFEAPTIASLTAALDAAHASYHPIVQLKSGRAERPLFIVHGVGGSVMELISLARRIDSDCAIYALQARGFDPDDKPHVRVEHMAKEYVTAIREMQPHGPYLLAGYSFGGLVAFEMARTLALEDEQIAFLGVLDTTVHETYWPFAAWSEYVVRRARHHALAARAMKMREWGPFVGRVWNSLLGHLQRGIRSEVPQDAEMVNLPERVRQVRSANYSAMTAYGPQPSDIAVTLFRSDLSLSNLCDPKRIWSRLAPGCRIYEIPGNHETIIRPPHLHSLAEQLSRCLRQAQHQTPCAAA